MDKSIGTQIKKLRKELAWTQSDLAEIVGTSTSYISDIERGKAIPGFRYCKEFAKAFNLNYVAGFFPDDNTPIVDTRDLLTDTSKNLQMIIDNINLELGQTEQD